MREKVEHLNTLLRKEGNETLNKDISKKTQKILTPKEKDKIKEIYIKIIRETKSLVKKSNDIPEILEYVFKHLNELSKKIETKKVYKFPYDNSYKNFSTMATYKKIRELMISKYKNNLSNSNYNGGNCHNWSLLYHDFFEELNPSFLIFEPYSAHSILIINFNKNIYIADSNQQNKFNIKKMAIGDELNIGNHYIAKITNLNPLSFNIISRNILERPNYTGKILKNKDEFINYLDNKEQKYFLLEYNNIEKNGEKTLYSFYIYKNKDKINIVIEGILGKKERNISFTIRKIKSENNKDIINEIFKKTQTKIPEDKKTIIDGIVNKIPKGFLRKIINTKKNKN